MGCDIHLFAEAKKKKTIIDWIMFWRKPKWESIETEWETDEYYEDEVMRIPYKKEFYTGYRNYNLFSALCGVRSESFANEPPKISEPKGLPDGVCDLIKGVSDHYDTDGHSHNYNTLCELKDFDWSEYGKTVQSFLDEVIPKMEDAGVSEDDVRIVYWFDN